KYRSGWRSRASKRRRPNGILNKPPASFSHRSDPQRTAKGTPRLLLNELLEHRLRPDDLAKSTFMNAMVLTKTDEVCRNPLQLQERAIPAPKDDELLVKIHVCGVCRTDLHVVEGELPDPALPLIPGHQAVGMVVQVGSGVADRKVGD